MRILFVIKSLSVTAGGAERVLTTVSNELAKRNHSVAVATFDGPGREDFYSLDPNVPRVRLGVGDAANRTTPRELLKRIFALRKAARDYRPDVAVGFMHSSFVPLSLALMRTHIPVIACERIASTFYRSRRIEMMALKLAALFVKLITINGRGALNSFPPAIRRKMILIPNPVGQAKKKAEVAGNDNRPKVLLTVGRLCPQKDQEVLVRAFGRIKARDNWKLRIVGSGELRDSLTELVENLGLSSRVDIVSPARSIEVEYQNAQLFALPSHYEGFPNSLAEALAHGLPAVGFADCPGTNDLIQSGVNGILAHGPDRVEALALALEPLMASGQLRGELGKAAVSSIEGFALENVVDQWENLFSCVTKKTGS